MLVNMDYVVFEGEGFPVDDPLTKNLKEDEAKLAKQMMASGHYQNGLDVSKFLDPDLSVDISRLALATILAVRMLESSSDNDVTLNVINLDKYFEARGIAGDEKQEREEKIFLMTFISGEAMEASNCDTLVVKFI